MNERVRRVVLGGLGLLVAAGGLLGCVPQARYDAAVAEAARMRNELWQRNVELSATRWMADRLAQENAALRAAPSTSPAGLATRVDEIARRQDRVEELLRALENKVIVPQASPPLAPTTPARDPLRSRF